MIVRPVSERVRMGTEPNRIEGGSEGRRGERGVNSGDGGE